MRNRVFYVIGIRFLYVSGMRAGRIGRFVHLLSVNERVSHRLVTGAVYLFLVSRYHMFANHAFLKDDWVGGLSGNHWGIRC